MGDRINLQFTDGEEFSPVLYAHWAGMSLIEEAKVFWAEHKDEIRSEPSNWMVNFISAIRKGQVMDGSFYLYPDFRCSADDNGDWIFNTVTGECHRE